MTPILQPLIYVLAFVAVVLFVQAGAAVLFSRRDQSRRVNRRLEMLESGMTPADVIRAATSIAARTFKADDEMGTLAPGKLANLVFVARNPLDDIKALREVVLTVKRGRAYPRSDYRQPDAKTLDEDY